MSSGLRIGLFVSSIVVVVFALCFFTYTMTKVVKMKKKLKEDQLKLLDTLAKNEGEQKLIEREDFGESIEELRQKIGESIDHEIVEFCINSCIRNNFKKILFVGQTGPYELITLSNKADVDVFVENSNIDHTIYLEIKKIFNKKHSVEIIKEVENEEYDAILSLNAYNESSQIFERYEKNLKHRGMFIFANTRNNKKENKLLITKIHKLCYKYDMLKWHNGFVVMVKEKGVNHEK